jgi:hypothetical protein
MRFWKRKSNTPVVEVLLDDDSLDRAIRSGVQFELTWFLSQSPEVQEAIAIRRDRWLEDVIVAAGYANLDPESTRLAILAEGGDEDAEVELESLNAGKVAGELERRRVLSPSGETSSDSGLTMGGFGERQAAVAAAEDKAKPSFFGAVEVQR